MAMSEDERSKRSNRLKKRLNEDKSKSKKKSGSGESIIKDRPSVLMYLPEELHQELDLKFDELNLEYKKETGESLQKNKDFYPAIIKAGLEGKDIKDILDI